MDGSETILCAALRGVPGGWRAAARSWPSDRGARAGTGVDAVHVWAYPEPGSGTAPILLGTANRAARRRDVATRFGERFEESGFELRVEGLAPGVYGLLVAAHSTVTGQFERAAVRVTVR